MRLKLSIERRKEVIRMIENGASNREISLKFPGMTKTKIKEIYDDLNKGTFETRAKLKRDPLLVLYKAGDVDLTELYAADNIRYAFSSIADGLQTRIMDFREFIDVFKGKPTEDEKDRNIRLQEQYATWFDECTKERIKVGPIIHVLTEPVSLRETDRYYGYRNGTAKIHLIKGLKLYVKLFKPRGNTG